MRIRETTFWGEPLAHNAPAILPCDEKEADPTVSIHPQLPKNSNQTSWRYLPTMDKVVANIGTELINIYVEAFNLSGSKKSNPICRGQGSAIQCQRKTCRSAKSLR